jgi:hypothetical protein
LMKFNEFLGLSKEPQASEDDHQHWWNECHDTYECRSYWHLYVFVYLLAYARDLWHCLGLIGRLESVKLVLSFHHRSGCRRIGGNATLVSTFLANDQNSIQKSAPIGDKTTHDLKPCLIPISNFGLIDFF